MRDVIMESRVAIRSLCRDAGFTTAFVLVLAIGLGVSTAIYAVTNATLVKGFALVPDNDRLFYVTPSVMYYPDFDAWRSQSTSIHGLALVRNSPKLIDDGSGSPATYFATELTTDGFDVLGVQPAQGRNFLPLDGEPGASPVVILSHEFWKSHFGAATDVVGRTIRLDGQIAVIVGVMPEGFSFPTDQEIWIPLVPTSAARERTAPFGRYAFGRIADGATLSVVQEELSAISARLATQFPDADRNVTPVVTTASEWFLGDRAVLLFESMFGAAVVIVIMAWANAVTLATLRTIRKTREFAMRLALGASRGRIMWSLILENMMLSLAAGAVAWWIARTVVAAYASAQVPNTTLRVWDYSLDKSALAYLGALTIASGTAAGLIIAGQLISLGGDLTGRIGTRAATVGAHHRRLYQVLVSVAVAMTMVLLVAASALTRSFLSIYNADVGVDVANVISMSLYAAPERYPDVQSRLTFYSEVSRRLRAIPGITSVVFANAAPGDNTRTVPFEIAGTPPADAASSPAVGVMTVADGYFQGLGAPVRQGREFTMTDTDGAEPVAVVNESFAKHYWPESSAIGEHIRLFPGKTPGSWLRVVGVVGNILQNRTRRSFEPLVYVPHAQNPIANLFAMGRTSGAPDRFAAAINRELHTVDPNLPVPALWSLQQRFDRVYGVERNVMILFVGFAIVALMVAAAGLYCIVSRAVQYRSREIAIRSAVGATTKDINRLVLRQAMDPTVAGVMLGWAGSIAVHRWLGSELVSVSAFDPVSAVLAAALLIIVASMASAMPMFRAARIPSASVFNLSID